MDVSSQPRLRGHMTQSVPNHATSAAACSAVWIILAPAECSEAMHSCIFFFKSSDDPCLKKSYTINIDLSGDRSTHVQKDPILNCHELSHGLCSHPTAFRDHTAADAMSSKICLFTCVMCCSYTRTCAPLSSGLCSILPVCQAQLCQPLGKPKEDKAPHFSVVVSVP